MLARLPTHGTTVAQLVAGCSPSSISRSIQASTTSDGHDGAAVARHAPESTTTSDDSSYISILIASACVLVIRRRILCGAESTSFFGLSHRS
jgi:hypothetical protein